MASPVDPSALTAGQVFWLLTVDHLTGRRPSHDVQVGCAVAVLVDLLDSTALRAEDAAVILGAAGGAVDPPRLAPVLARYTSRAGPGPVRWEHVLTPLAATAWDDVSGSLDDTGWVVRGPGRWLGRGDPRYATAEDAPIERLRTEIATGLREPGAATRRTRSVVLAAHVSGSVATLFRPVGWAVATAVEDSAARLVADDPRLDGLRRSVGFSDGWRTVGQGTPP